MSERAAGSIYDLGYRRYEGARLGRRYAALSLYVHGLRAAFGLGRRTRSKIFPFGLAIVASVPAIVQIMVAALFNTDDIEVVEAEEYYSSYVQFILVLFAAAVAPELLGRDQRHATLPLYFSRALSRHDYALARFGAMVTAMLALTLGPQALMFVGNALVGTSFGDYFREEWRQIGPIIASGILVSLFLAAISLNIAALTPRRAFATIGVVVPFVLLPVISVVFVEILDTIVGRLGVFLGPFNVMNGFTYWLFDASGQVDGPLETADFAGGYYFLFALAIVAAGLTLLLRRYGRQSL